MNKKSVAIVGMAHQGLALSQLFRDAGYDVWTLFSRTEAIRSEFFKAKSVKMHGAILFETANQIIDSLFEISNGLGSKLLVIITSSDALSMLVLKRPDLWDMKVFDVMARPFSAIKTLSDKNWLYCFLESKSLPIRKFCKASNFSESHGMSFPIVLKRNIEDPRIYDYKFKRIKSKETLINTLNGIPDDILSLLILQEEIPTSCYDLDFRGFVNKGEIVSFQVVKEIRCFPAGVPSYLEEITDQYVVANVTKTIAPILKEVNYTGFVGVDIKYDAETSLSYVLDINTRPPASVSSWLYKYPASERYIFASDIDNAKSMRFGRPIRWVNLMRDFKGRCSSRSLSGIFRAITAKKDMKWPGDQMVFWFNPAFMLYRRLLNLSKK